jgi:hypothetical protein
MTGDSLRIAPGAMARVVPGPALAPRPLIWLSSPAVALRGPQAVGGPDAVLAATVGSTEWLWEDAESWRFETGGGALWSAVLNLPEVNTAGSGLVEAWTRTPITVGSLELLDPHDFRREPTRVRWCDPRGEWLFGLYTPEPDHGGERRRLSLASDTYLLIRGEVLVGWAVNRPARILASESDGRVRQEADAPLGRLLATFLSLVTEDGVDRLEAGDRVLRADLVRVDEELEGLCRRHEPRALAMREKIRQILEDYARD